MMMHSATWLLWLLFTGCMNKAPLQKDTAIVQADSYHIIVPSEPTDVEQKAAVELKKHLEGLKGAVVTIAKEGNAAQGQTIYIGDTDKGLAKIRESISEQGFRIINQERESFIRGGKGGGLLYGIFEWIERTTGTFKLDGEVAVINPGFSIPGNWSSVQAPAFIYREVYYPPSFDNEYLVWNKLHRFEDLWGIWGHSYFKIIPPSKYFKSHPEYFSFYNGKRQATQLCLSNANVFNLAVEYFRKQIEVKPWAEYYSISANDEADFCHCDACAQVLKEEGAPSGSLIRFVNKIAGKFPNHRFTTLAYTSTSKPPAKTKPARNVFIMLSTIDAYRTLPIEKDRAAASFRSHLQGWGKLTDNLFIWDYTTQFTNYLAPFPNLDNLQKDLNYFVRHKVKGVFSQGSENSYSDLAEIKSYITAKLLWNPNLDLDSLKNSFCKMYYGSAAPHVLFYINKLSEAVKATGTNLDIYGNPINNYVDYLSPALIDKYSAILDKAEALVEENKLYYERVSRLRLSLEYTVLQQARFFGAERFGYRTLNEDGEIVVKPGYPARVQRFVAAAVKAGVKELSEGGTTPGDYLREWNVAFAEPYRKNIAKGSKLTLTNPFVIEYPAKKEHTLIDEVFGFSDFSYNWLLTSTKDLQATIDLGNEKTISSITTNFMYDPRHWIFLPSSVNVETSDDGVKFTPVSTKKILMADDEDFALKIHHVAFRFEKSLQSRYIRFTASNIPKLPYWRSRPNRNPLIACDEILVQ